MALPPHQRPLGREHRPLPVLHKEQKELGLGDFSKIPNGIGGVEHRMDLIYQGVVDGQDHRSPRWVELCATTPARMFGLYPRKGVHRAGLRCRRRRLRPERHDDASASTRTT